MPTETYNPQTRTFIKKPEPKVCVTCGQLIQPDVKPITNHMSNYLNKISGNVVTINSENDEVSIQGVTLYKILGRNVSGGWITTEPAPPIEALTPPVKPTIIPTKPIVVTK